MGTAGWTVGTDRARFAGFELDLRSGELTKNGRKLRVQEQPFRVLKLLLERAGEMVSREELQRQLWPAETFVDFDHGLNKAVAKLRDVLDERDAELSLIETLPRRGYRFVAAVEWVETRSELQDPKSVAIGKPLPQRRRKWWFIGVAVAVVAGLSGFLFWRQVHTRPISRPIRSVAVLPLVNLSGDASEDYFADGMTDELITMLAKNTSLRVVSRTSVMRYKGVSRPVHDIARELGTDGILEGSISKSANRVHLTVQLVEGENDAHIWAESYDRDLQDAVTLLSELSETIARQVKMATSQQPRSQREINPAAHDAYLRGRAFWFDVDYGQSQDFFEKAIQLQPDYAAAWSGLADSYTVRAVAGEVPSSEVRDKALAAARRALALDDSLGDAHKSMAAVYYFLEWNWKEADAESLRAIQLIPSDSEAHHLRSYVLGALGRSEESLQEQMRASQLDPDLRPWALGRAFLYQRRFNDAIKELRNQLKAHPHENNIRFMLANAYHFAGMAKESIQEREEGYRVMGDNEGENAIQREFAKGGEKAVERWELDRWKKRSGSGLADLVGLAGGYARVGDKENALRALEAAYEQRCASLVWIEDEPAFDVLHSEPRYRAIIKKMGLPPL